MGRQERRHRAHSNRRRHAADARSRLADGAPGGRLAAAGAGRHVPVGFEFRTGVGKKKAMMRWALSIALWTLSVPAYAQEEPGFPRPSYDMMEPGTIATARLPQLEDVTFKQRLNTRLPLVAMFKDETGRPVTLGQYFDGKKPVFLAIVYYSCPMLCTQVMNGVSSAVKVLPFSAGKDFDVVFVSFDPRDKPETAAAKKTALMNYWSTQNQSGA